MSTIPTIWPVTQPIPPGYRAIPGSEDNKGRMLIERNVNPVMVWETERSGEKKD